MAQANLAIQAMRGRHRHAFTGLAAARGVIHGWNFSPFGHSHDAHISGACVPHKAEEIVSDGALAAHLTIRAITVRDIDPATTPTDPVIDPISTTG